MDNSKSTEITNEKLEEKVNETTVNNETKVENSSTVSTNTVTESTESKENETQSVTDSSVSTTVDESGKEKEEEHEIKMEYIDKDFCYDLMSVPTVSDEEYRLVTYIILWARRNNIKYEFDEKGNIYLTKGKLEEGEYYPCVTSHLDTVQTKQKAYAQAGCRLDVKTRYIEKDKHHEIYVDGMGIGGDDKAGVVICLSMFSHFDKLKAAFFLCEERGCIGSNAMDISKLDNVGYVMGFDSPELNRAAYACSGVRLFSKDFFETYMQDICKEHGLTDFRSEPYTDVKVIRDKTDLMCMNFGTGYYFCHMPNEYCVLEEMDNACKMGVALIKRIGNTRHEYSFKSSGSSWVKTADGTYKQVKDKDEDFFRKLSGITTYYSGCHYYGQGGGYYDDWDDDYTGYGSRASYSGTSKTTTTATSTTPTSSTTTSASSTNKNDSDSVPTETVEYIVEKYDEHINSIKEKVEETCKQLGVDFNKFKEAFSTEIKF